MSIDDRSSSSADEPQRDAWLTEALRHAPDADVTPPSALSDSILREARAATRAALPAGARVVARNPLAAAWAWLARPPVAAGFASVMVATVVGLMWWDRPLDESFTARPTETAREAASTVATASAPNTDRIAAAPQRPAARSASPLQKAARGTSKERETAKLEPGSDASGRKATDSVNTDASPEAFPTTPPATLAPNAATMAAPAPSATTLTEPPIAPLDAAIASIARDPRPWSWQRSAGSLPMTESVANWLRQLQAASTASSWRSTTEAPPETRPLRIYRNGVLFGTVTVDAEAAWFTSPSQATTRAALTPAAAASLQRALDLAAP